MATAVEIEVDEASLTAAEKQLVTAVLQEQTRAVHGATRALEKDFEALFRAAVPGKAWRVWRSRVYPSRGGPANEPVGIVFPNGGPRSAGMARYFTHAGVNRAKHGDYLAVPLRAALGTSSGKDISPREWEARFRTKLRPLFRAGQTPLLVADGAIDGSGNFVAAGRAEAKIRGGQRLKRAKTIAVFALVSEQEFANTVSTGPAIRRARDDIGTRFRRGLAKLNRGV